MFTVSKLHCHAKMRKLYAEAILRLNFISELKHPIPFSNKKNSSKLKRKNLKDFLCGGAHCAHSVNVNDARWIEINWQANNDWSHYCITVTALSAQCVEWMASAKEKKILFTINHRCFGFGVAGRKWTRHIHHSQQRRAIVQGGANGRDVRSLNCIRIVADFVSQFSYAMAEVTFVCATETIAIIKIMIHIFLLSFRPGILVLNYHHCRC